MSLLREISRLKMLSVSLLEFDTWVDVAGGTITLGIPESDTVGQRIGLSILISNLSHDIAKRLNGMQSQLK